MMARRDEAGETLGSNLMHETLSRVTLNKHGEKLHHAQTLILSRSQDRDQ